MTVERYDIEETSKNPFASYRCIIEVDEGDYVLYDDYQKLAETTAWLVSMLDVECDLPASLKEALEELEIL